MDANTAIQLWVLVLPLPLPLLSIVTGSYPPGLGEISKKKQLPICTSFVAPPRSDVRFQGRLALQWQSDPRVARHVSVHWLACGQNPHILFLPSSPPPGSSCPRPLLLAGADRPPSTARAGPDDLHKPSSLPKSKVPSCFLSLFCPLIFAREPETLTLLNHPHLSDTPTFSLPFWCQALGKPFPFFTDSFCWFHEIIPTPPPRRRLLPLVLPHICCSLAILHVADLHFPPCEQLGVPAERVEPSRDPPFTPHRPQSRTILLKRFQPVSDLPTIVPASFRLIENT